MSKKRVNILWGAGCTLLLVVTLVAMFFVAQAARYISAGIRQDLAAPGPPVTRSNLGTVMGDISLAPGLALDENATNDPAIRLQTDMLLGGAHNQWILVFRSTDPYGGVAAWYRRNLRGWYTYTIENERSERRRNGILQRAWTRNGDRLRLVFLPEHPGELTLIVSSPPPRRRAAMPVRNGTGPPTR